MNEQEFNFIKDWIQKPASIGDLRLIMLVGRAKSLNKAYFSYGTMYTDIEIILNGIDKDIEHVRVELRKSK